MSRRSLSSLPLAVDLDGTLCRTDTLWELFIRLVLRSPSAALACCFLYVRKGRPAFKKRVAELQDIQATDLLLNTELLEWLREEKARGRTLCLATAADAVFARRLVEPLDLFDDVLGSVPGVNLKSVKKGEALADKWGRQGFVYAGNESADLKVWKQAAGGVAVQLDPQTRRRVPADFEWEREFPSRVSPAKALVTVLRPAGYLWILYLLAGLWGGGALLMLLLGLSGFLLLRTAARTLLALACVPADRLHGRTGMEVPFAGGDVPLERGLIIGVAGFLAGFFCLITVSPELAWMGGIYLAAEGGLERIRRYPEKPSWPWWGLQQASLLGAAWSLILL